MAKKGRAGKFLKETIEAFAVAFVVAFLFIKPFIVQAFKIPSSSMEDALLIGDHLLVNKLSYGLQVPRPAMIKVLGLTVPFFETQLKPFWGEIKRGDVVVFRFPDDRSKDYIKRVVGLAGETVEVINKKIYINGKEWEENYGVFKGDSYEENTFGPYAVPQGHIFAMGDNRDRSYDSRFWGAVPVNDIKGKAFIIYFSFDRGKPSIRFERFGKIIR
jgi:signal peptidase I